MQDTTVCRLLPYADYIAKDKYYRDPLVKEHTPESLFFYKIALLS